MVKPRILLSCTVVLFLSLSCLRFTHEGFSTSPTMPGDDVTIQESIKPSATRTIQFSGYNWTVKDSNGELWGPGPNYFNSSNESVWLDGNGDLHLKIRNVSGNWHCAEVYTQSSFGHGKYRFEMASGFENLDVNIVLGLFTYLNDENEIDIEFARWGQASVSNGQYVLQPSYHTGNIHRFPMEGMGSNSSHEFAWCEEYVKFKSYWGDGSNPTGGNIISEWLYVGNDNPPESTEHVHINLWLMSGLAPANLQEAEVIVKGFDFTVDDCNEQVYLPQLITVLAITVPVGILVLAVSVVLWKRKR
ncbi:MAG: hypothetical protein ACFFCS_10555 [Candidatus Hodarchaeota archaeon]